MAAVLSLLQESGVIVGTCMCLTQNDDVAESPSQLIGPAGGLLCSKGQVCRRAQVRLG